MYTPSSPPTDPKDIPAYLVTEHAKIQAAIEQGRSVLNLVPQNMAPTRLKEGDVRYAAAPWSNALSNGVGTYQYRGGTWRFLG